MSREQVAEILDRVVAAYASCSSYRDIGERKLTMYSGADENRAVTAEGQFATAYVRPNRFRFDYQGCGPDAASKRERLVMWTQRNRVKAWGRRGAEIQSFLDLEHALHQLSLGSHITSFDSHVSFQLVPRPLLPTGAKTYLTHRFGNSDLIGIEESDGFSCYKLESHLYGIPKWRLWIDTRTYLVRQFEKEVSFSRAAFEQFSDAQLEEIRDRLAAYSLDLPEPGGMRDYLDTFEQTRTVGTLTYRPA